MSATTHAPAGPVPRRFLRPLIDGLKANWIRCGLSLAVILIALATDGLFTARSFWALVNSAALVGCVGLGMTFVTKSGNILSFALGATVGITSVTCAWLSSYGVTIAIAGSMAIAVVFNVIQGALIGFVRANPIIVSIAAAALAAGLTEFTTAGQTIYAVENVLDVFRTRVWGIPVSGLIFAAALLLSQIILSATVYGHQLTMMGSNYRASVAAGVNAPLTTAISYALAGLFASLAGILIAARYGAGTFEYGLGYDYSAIGAVLVGGTSVTGGAGSAWRTLFGVILTSVLSVILLLRGYSSEIQLLSMGVLVLVAVLAQGSWRK